jgi:hypothetical protein
MELRDLNTEPPGGWKYTQPETNFPMMARPLYALAQKVQQHRLNRNLPLVSPGYTDILAELQDYTCKRLSERSRLHWCKGNTVIPIQPGDLFAKIIFSITGKAAATCGKCAQRVRWMNAWKFWGCWKHRKEIEGWLLEECASRGHIITKDKMTSLVRAAFKELRSSKRAKK